MRTKKKNHLEKNKVQLEKIEQKPIFIGNNSKVYRCSRNHNEILFSRKHGLIKGNGKIMRVNR